LRFDFQPVVMHFHKPMTLSSQLQSADFMRALPTLSREQLRDHIFLQGQAWFGCHPEESDTIRKNCTAMGAACDDSLVKDIQHHILLHYFEKLLPFSMTPKQFHAYLTQRVSLPPEISILSKSIAEKRGVLLAVCHFGAIELIGPCLAALGIPFTSTLRFATKTLSVAARQKAGELSGSGLFADIQFIEIGAAASATSLEMAAVLRRGGLLCAVFDEPTRYGTEVTLFGQRISGGAGIDRLAAFMNNSVTIAAAFMTRTGDETYTLHLSDLTISGTGKDLIQTLYGTLEAVCLRPRLSQWYFLHEEIPFVK
jgi:lauroyl/myristoyl acyltransferase